MLLARALLLCLTCSAVFSLPSARAEAPVAPASSTLQTGELQGAPWRIDLPKDWNGELVMLAHGFEPVGTPRESVWPAAGGTGELLAAGYAVAQSGYASQGWAVNDGIADTNRLRAHFIARHPDTKRTWIIGFSMGGAVAIGTLEQLPQHYDGGVSLCGANLPGDVLAGEMLTSLLAFDYLFSGSEGLPDGGMAGPDGGVLPQGTLYQGIEAATRQHPEQAAILARRLEVTPEQLAGTVSLHALVWHQLVKRMGGVPVGNRQTRYAGFGDDAAFNAGVRRLAADPAAAVRLRKELPLTGALTRPLVLQYNHDDPSVSPRFEPVYAGLAAKHAKVPPVVLPPKGEGHCDFTGDEVVEALRAVPR